MSTTPENGISFCIKRRWNNFFPIKKITFILDPSKNICSVKRHLTVKKKEIILFLYISVQIRHVHKGCIGCSNTLRNVTKFRCRKSKNKVHGT